MTVNSGDLSYNNEAQTSQAKDILPHTQITDIYTVIVIIIVIIIREIWRLDTCLLKGSTATRFWWRFFFSRRKVRLLYGLYVFLFPLMLGGMMLGQKSAALRNWVNLLHDELQI